jgi:hypothetical protein
MSDSLIPLRFSCSGIDQTALQQRIAEGIVRRREMAAIQGIDFNRLARGEVVLGASASPWDRLLIYQNRICVQPSRVERFSTGIGLVDRLLRRVRRELHSIVIFYCNLLGQKQMLFNRELLQVLESLISLSHSIEALQTRVAAMEDRIASLEHQRDEGVS